MRDALARVGDPKTRRTRPRAVAQLSPEELVDRIADVFLAEAQRQSSYHRLRDVRRASRFAKRGRRRVGGSRSQQARACARPETVVRTVPPIALEACGWILSFEPAGR